VTSELEFFSYELPEQSIAQVPAEPRDSARLLVVDGPDVAVAHQTVSDLRNLLRSGDLLVVNDTRVRRARLNLIKSTGGAAEVLLTEPDGDPQTWLALVKPGKRLPPGTILYDGEQPVVEILSVGDDGQRRVRVIDHERASKLGTLPLPPYISPTLDSSGPRDPERYQTVYSRREGSVAAPTAGLHLTLELFTKLQAAGVEVARVELEVGLSTFRPITTPWLADHEMHHETYRIEPEVWSKIQSAKRVVAVGTTVVRTLESAAATGELTGSTNLFIREGFDWNVVDVLMTNFHMPRSTLLVLVDAFIGHGWKDFYADAIEYGYGVGSFGDAMLLTRSV
jgi:S-adenosylmethionine:tRNA ribosyltransferase-isomerase